MAGNDNDPVRRTFKRKTFLSTSAALGGAALVPPVAAEAKLDASAHSATAAGAPAALRGMSYTEAIQLAQIEQRSADAPQSDVTVSDPGSDFMIDVLKTLNIDYVASNPGSTFRGFHESLINYGKNSAPEFITCTHEEVAVAMCHGYAKAAGKPMMALIHSNVGLQHGSMAIFNAWADRVPIILMAGNLLDANKRRPGAEWDHSAIDPAEIVRSSIKWDDQPGSLQAYADSTVRAYRNAMAAPSAPVFLSLDAELQEAPITRRASLTIPKYHAPIPPSGDPAALEDLAKSLAAAEYPLIIADRAVKTQAGMDHIVTLAETLGAPVLDLGARLNFPSLHRLNLTGADARAIAQADVILFLEPTDVWGTLFRYPDTLERRPSRIAKPTARIATIGMEEFNQHSNNQDQQRFYAADLPIVGDVEASLPTLIEALRRAASGNAAKITARADATARQHAQMREAAHRDAMYAYDATPISVARVAMELGAALQHEDWSLVTPMQFLSKWPYRLWSFDKHYRFLGTSGAAGQGYGAPASVGAALANKKLGRFSVSVEGDGDLMYQPGSFWTAAHHRIPLLTIVHNNGAYHQETMHVQRMANRRQRGITNAHIGTGLLDPPIDFAMMVKGMGVWTAGPVTDPRALRATLDRAVAVVKRGEPALVDVRMQPR